MRLATYIWIDGTKPVAQLRAKTKVITKDVLKHDMPIWGFDGSSTKQGTTFASDCILKPVKTVRDPFRGKDSWLVLCEVLNPDGTPGVNNHRATAAIKAGQVAIHKPWFGIEQEYTLLRNGRRPYGINLKTGKAVEQGPYYCSVGYGNCWGREIAEEHLQHCITAGLKICGINAEVMPGQWEFQIGPGDPLIVADDLWLARYILYRVAEQHYHGVTLDSKPHKELNGAGCHTNYSTLK